MQLIKRHIKDLWKSLFDIKGDYCTRNFQWWTQESGLLLFTLLKQDLLFFQHSVFIRMHKRTHTRHPDLCVNVFFCFVYIIIPGPQIHLQSWDSETKGRPTKETPGLCVGTNWQQFIEWQQRAFSCLVPGILCPVLLPPVPCNVLFYILHMGETRPQTQFQVRHIQYFKAVILDCSDSKAYISHLNMCFFNSLI